MNVKDVCINCGEKEFKDLLCHKHFYSARESRYVTKQKPCTKRGKNKNYTDDVDDRSYPCHAEH